MKKESKYILIAVGLFIILFLIVHFYIYYVMDFN